MNRSSAAVPPSLRVRGSGHSERCASKQTRISGARAEVKKVVLVLCDPWACLGLNEVVKRVLPHVATKTFTRAMEAIEYLKGHSVDLAILGVNTDDLDGLDHVPEVAEQRLASRIIAVTPRYDYRTMTLWRRSERLVGLLDSNTVLDRELNYAVESAIGNKRFISPSLEEKLSASRGAPETRLSVREELALSILGEGVDDREAAARLKMPSATMRCHRQRIMHKLCLHQKGELTAFAMQNVYTRFTSCGVLHPGFDRQLANGSADESGIVSA